MKYMCMLLALIMLLMTPMASAEVLVSNDYKDVPAVMTQDSVLELTVDHEQCTIETLQPDEISVALLHDVYEFVWEEGNRPARYYDEETQWKISDLIGGLNIDVLHMTEDMRLQLGGEPRNPVTDELEKTVTADMLLDVDYRVGQLVVVVLGIPDETNEAYLERIQEEPGVYREACGYTWFPYRGHVIEEGLIRWTMPTEDWMVLREQPINFHVLTDRVSPRRERLVKTEYHVDRDKIFSKDSFDVIQVRKWYTMNGTVIDDDFRVWLVELSEKMQQEVRNIGQFLEEGGKILDWFPADRRREARLMLPVDADPDDMIAYDIIALRDENYKDTYGDVNVDITFSTMYNCKKPMIILAGFVTDEPEEQPYVENPELRTCIDWYVLRAEALRIYEDRDDSYLVEIGLKQLNLPVMEQEPMMLVLLSEDLEKVDEEQQTNN